MSASGKTRKQPSIEIEGTLPERSKGLGPRSASVPRVARVLALAIRLQKLIDAGEAASYAALERVAGASRARVSQILGLQNLAPDLQESILFLTTDPPREKDIRKIAREADWVKQRSLWYELRKARVKS